MRKEVILLEVAAVLDVVVKTARSSEGMNGTEPTRPARTPSTGFATVLARQKEDTGAPKDVADQPEDVSSPEPRAGRTIDTRLAEDEGGRTKRALAEGAATVPCVSVVNAASRSPSTQTVVPNGEEVPIDTATMAKLVGASIQGNTADSNLVSAANDQTLLLNGTDIAAMLKGLVSQNLKATADDIFAAMNASQGRAGDFAAWLKTLGFSIQEAAGNGIMETESGSAPAGETARPGASDRMAPPAESRPALGVMQVQDASLAKSGSAAPVAPVPDQATLAILNQIAIRGVRYLVSQQEKTITIHLVPQSLGELRLEVSAAQDGMHVRFISPSPAVRDALEGQLAGLKDSLARNGIEVAKVSVLPGMTGYASSQYSAGNGGASFTPAPAVHASAASLRLDSENAASIALQPVSPHEGLLNVYV